MNLKSLINKLTAAPEGPIKLDDPTNELEISAQKAIDNEKYHDAASLFLKRWNQIEDTYLDTKDDSLLPKMRQATKNMLFCQLMDTKKSYDFDCEIQIMSNNLDCPIDGKRQDLDDALRSCIAPCLECPCQRKYMCFFIVRPK